MSLPAAGQTTRGSLSGLVNDASGAALPNANVAVRHLATGEEFSGTTDAQGAFVFPSLPLGQFTVVVEAAGFKRAEVKDVVLEVSTPAKVTVALEHAIRLTWRASRPGLPWPGSIPATLKSADGFGCQVSDGDGSDAVDRARED